MRAIGVRNPQRARGARPFFAVCRCSTRVCRVGRTGVVPHATRRRALRRGCRNTPRVRCSTSSVRSLQLPRCVLRYSRAPGRSLRTATMTRRSMASTGRRCAKSIGLPVMAAKSDAEMYQGAESDGARAQGFAYAGRDGRVKVRTTAALPHSHPGSHCRL